MPNVSLTEPTTNPSNFQFTLRGHIELVEGVSYLVCQDNTRFRLKESPPDAPQGIASWQVIPSTDSTGILQNLSIESYSIAQTDATLPEECRLRGRVVQLGKRGQCVQLKVSRPGEKTLKISFVSPDRRMKIGQMWQVVAVRQGDTLHILQAAPIEETHHAQPLSPSVSSQSLPDNNCKSSTTSTKTTTNTQSSKRRLDEVSPPHETAIAALIAETQIGDWELATPKQRANMKWEWEAFHPLTQQKARVEVFGLGKKAKVYQYPSPTSQDLKEDSELNDSHSQDESNPKSKSVSVAAPLALRHEVQELAAPSAIQNLKSNDHLAVTPLGAARGIGASCFQILIGPYEIVLDCGTRPKGYDPLPALEYLNNPNLLLISHAHQDHLGAVPVFHRQWPGVRMICTPGTREIAHVMLTDCLKVQQNREDSPELFDEADLERTLFRLETEPIGIDFEPLPGLKVRFINAGHILGAACIYIRYGERSLLYTGDYNTTSSRTTTGLRLADLPAADILITESTYGADTHPARKMQETALLEAIASVVQARGNVLIPAFALGRAQEILLAIRTSNIFHKLKVPVYVDGLVRAVTDVFRENLQLLPPSVQNLVKQNGREPFFDPAGVPPIIPITTPKERPLAMANPSVIVASSGMLTGGPSVYYATTLLERENAAIFISGYTDEESPGRLLTSIQTGDKLELDGKEITVRAQVKRFNLSAHADKVGLTQVINKVNPKHLILIHGSGNALHELARSGDLQSKHYIHIPTVGEQVEYGQVPEHLTSKQITKINLPQEFEVELTAEVEGAWLRIPQEVVERDPRWQMLANSGLLKAKWEGSHLKLSPITSQTLARQKGIEDAIASGQDCCAVCQFFASGLCQCEESALFEFQVDPMGVCTEFSHL